MNENEWNPIAEKWDNATQNGNWFHKYIIYPIILKILGDPTGMRIIDVGCGNGHLSYLLHTKGASVTGIDKSDAMIHICKLRHSNIQFMEMDVTKTTVFKSEFDCAIFNNSIQDMDNYKNGIESVHEMLVSGGKLIIVVKHPCFHPRSQDNGWKILFEKSGKRVLTGHGLTSLLDEKEKFSGLYYIMDNYYSKDPHNREWYGNSTTSFTRTLEEYFQTIISSGFTITGVYEPKPEPDGKLENESLYNLLLRIPNFLVIYAIRSN